MFIRYHAHLSDAREIARQQSITDDCVYHVDSTGSGLYYISDWYTCQTLLSYEYGIERKAEVNRA